jgi:hypothetical protein
MIRTRSCSTARRDQPAGLATDRQAAVGRAAFDDTETLQHGADYSDRTFALSTVAMLSARRSSVGY